MAVAGYCFEKDYTDIDDAVKKVCRKNGVKKIVSDRNTSIGRGVDTVIFWGFTDSSDDLLYIKNLKSNGIKCIYADESGNLSDAEYVVGAYVYALKKKSIAHSERIRAAKRKNAEKGRVPNSVFGYDKVPGDIFGQTVNRYEARVVKRIFAMYTADKKGVGAIADALNSENIKTKRGCAWSQNSVSRILKNELYTGRIIGCKQRVGRDGQRVENDKSEQISVYKEDMRIIDDKTFDAANELLKSKKYNFTRRGEKSVFSSLIKCSECGSSFRRVVRTYKNTYKTWVCGGRNAKGEKYCDNSLVIDELDLAEALRNYFEDLIKNRDKVTEFLKSELPYNIEDFDKMVEDAFLKMRLVANGSDDFSGVISKMTAYPDGAVDIYLKVAADMGINKTIDL